MSEVGYIWLPHTENLFDDLAKYLKDCVPFDTFEEAIKEEEDAYYFQKRQFGTEGPMCIVKVTVEVEHAHYADEPDYDYFEGSYEEVSHG